jgi:phenylpropionate dioxygenase-like ring-hydroxylating dioxygenase large terminal subunit
VKEKVASIVEPDRVHRDVYVSPEIFELEISNIFEKTWIYCGHESQIKKVGDFYTFTLGRQPMVLVRGADGKAHVVYNRCPHRGVQLCASRAGNTGDMFTCSYHGWTFHLDGLFKSMPLPKGYDGTRFATEHDCNLARAPRVDSYRGFIFASLATNGPSLLEWLGGAKVAFDNMCDRSPEGEVEIVPNCNRVIQRSNWKFFMENQLDALHPHVTHRSTGDSAQDIEEKIFDATGDRPLHYHMLSTFVSPFDEWDKQNNLCFPNGHCVSDGYMGLRPTDPDSLEYERLLAKRYGQDQKEKILSTSIHHALIYPCLSVQPLLQQLRVLRPISNDRTLSEIWHFRLKGAPEAIYRRSLWYYNLVNSPATMINADDLENWQRGQRGLAAEAQPWVSFHREAGKDVQEGDVVRTVVGTSEAPMRNQYRAWTQYMTAEA